MMWSGKAKTDFIIRGRPDQLQAGPAPGWRIKILFHGSTAFLDELMVHVGALDGHLSPHPLHQHDHEELHFALSDSIEFVIGDDVSEAEQTLALAKGSVVFTDSHAPHTFRNIGNAPASYLHLRWKRNEPAVSGKPGLWFLDQGTSSGIADPASSDDGSVERIVYSGPTRYLSRITLKRIELPSGGQVPLHRHDHEVMFALVDGAVDILGRRVVAPGFAFMGSRVPHCLNNPGPAPAALYAVEFHRPS